MLTSSVCDPLTGCILYCEADDEKIRKRYTSTIFVSDRYCTMDNNPPRYPVTCEIDGKAHRGTYWIAGKILTVSTGMGGKSKQVGSTPAEILATQLLQELAKEGKA